MSKSADLIIWLRKLAGTPQPPLVVASLAQDNSAALDKFASWMATREELASVLEAHGCPPSQGKAKLLELYGHLTSIGAGQWIGKTYVPTVALSDPHLLSQLLDIERSDKHSGRAKWQAMAIAALDHVEAKARKT